MYTVKTESGQALLGYALLALVIVIVAVGIYSLLTGNTTILDMYNATGELFQSIG